jgi:hypothetical protein
MRLVFANLLERLHFSVLLLGLIGTVLGAAGCKENPVGRQCFIPTNGSDGGVPVTIVGAPALECQSRTCVHIANHEPDLCSGECESDEDCDTSPESPCKSGFTCMVPVVVGNFCCKKLCVCKDYVGLSDGGVPPPEPAACNPAEANNECCNLPGRRENPTRYPVCQI